MSRCTHFSTTFNEMSLMIGGAILKNPNRKVGVVQSNSSSVAVLAALEHELRSLVDPHLPQETRREIRPLEDEDFPGAHGRR